MNKNEFRVCSKPNESTHLSGSVIDQVTATKDIADKVQVHELAEDQYDTMSNHTLIP